MPINDNTPRPQEFAAVDLGSNSFHMVIAREVDGAMQIIGRLKQRVHLADGLDARNMLSEEAMERGLNCLSLFAERLQGFSPSSVCIVGTHTLRQALNAPEFLKRAEKVIPYPIEIISGNEEARLIFMGVEHTQPEKGRKLVIDIGGGSTDIAVISMGGRVRAASLPVAGNAFDQCIAQYVQEKFNIAIGPLTAEALKKQVACCTKSEFEGVMEIRGHSWETNLPARRLVYTRDLYLPVQELAARIAATARNVLESTPPELAADVAKNGILLTGGGSMLRGLAGYIAGELHVDVAIAPDPINCVARGTAASLTLGQYLTAGFRDATPRAWHNRLQSPEGFSN